MTGQVEGGFWHADDVLFLYLKQWALHGGLVHFSVSVLQFKQWERRTHKQKEEMNSTPEGWSWPGMQNASAVEYLCYTSAVLREQIKRGNRDRWNIYREIIQWIQHILMTLKKKDDPFSVARWMGTPWPEKDICQTPIVFITLWCDVSGVPVKGQNKTVVISVWQKQCKTKKNHQIHRTNNQFSKLAW